ncbi:hypothetical protein [Spirosoma panaciterrae]|nr:hypothetical protein [Spirosoma panaciterrae]
MKLVLASLLIYVGTYRPVYGQRLRKRPNAHITGRFKVRRKADRF